MTRGFLLHNLLFAAVLSSLPGCTDVDGAGGTGGSGGGAGAAGSATGGSSGGGTGGGGSGGTGGGGSDCDCTLGGYEPVCGVDGDTYDAICGADCVPVDIACLGECPCDPDSSDCDIGCTAMLDSGWCDSPTVEWVCDGGAREDVLVEVGCENLPTGAIRYCCPPEFLSACQ